MSELNKILHIFGVVEPVMIIYLLMLRFSEDSDEGFCTFIACIIMATFMSLIFTMFAWGFIGLVLGVFIK